MKTLLRKLFSIPAISLIVAIFAVLVPIAIFFFSLGSKEFAFGVIAQSALVDLSDSSLADLEVSFRGQKLARVESLTLRFENSGNTPIEARDFDRDMEIILAPGSRILSASVAEASPADIKPIIATTDETVSIEPLLLNPGDRFSVTLIIGGDPGLPKLNARVSGIRRIIRLDPPSHRQLSRGILLSGAGFLAGLIYFYLGGVVGLRVTHSKVVPWRDGLLLALASGIVAAYLLVTAGRFLEFEGWTMSVFGLAIALSCSPAYIVAKKRVRAISTDAHASHDK